MSIEADSAIASINLPGQDGFDLAAYLIDEGEDSNPEWGADTGDAAVNDAWKAGDLTFVSVLVEASRGGVVYGDVMWQNEPYGTVNGSAVEPIGADGTDHTGDIAKAIEVAVAQARAAVDAPPDHPTGRSAIRFDRSCRYCGRYQRACGRPHSSTTREAPEMNEIHDTPRSRTAIVAEDHAAFLAVMADRLDEMFDELMTEWDNLGRDGRWAAADLDHARKAARQGIERLDREVKSQDAQAAVRA